MSETLGSLVDKLSIINIKLFMVQDKVSHAAYIGEGLDAETTAQVVGLNRQRTGLINELNALTGEETIIKLVDREAAQP